MTISVVIAWGKKDGDVVRAISSAVRQTTIPIEVIVVVNGEVSYADALEVCDNNTFDQNLVTFILVPGCTNANIARNIGVAASKGDLVAFLDSDDWWDADHLAQSISVLESESADLVYSGMRIYKGRSSTIELIAQDYRLYGNVETYLLSYQPAQTSSFVSKRSALINCLWDVSLKRHQDYEFLSRFSKARKIVHSERVTANIDWVKPRRHHNHSDCFKVVSAWQPDVPISLYRRHLTRLLISAIKSRDFIWVSKIYSFFCVLLLEKFKKKS